MFDELHDPNPRRSTPADVVASLRRGDSIRRHRHLVHGGVGSAALVVVAALGVNALAGSGHTDVRISAAGGPSPGASTASTAGPASDPSGAPGTTPSSLGAPTPSSTTPPRSSPGSTTKPAATTSTTVAVTAAPPTTARPAVGRVHLTRADNQTTITVAPGTTIEIALGPDPTSPEGSPSSIDTSIVTVISETHGADGSSTTVLSAVGPGHTQILGPWGGVPCDAGACPAIAVAHFGVTVNVT